MRIKNRNKGYSDISEIEITEYGVRIIYNNGSFLLSSKGDIVRQYENFRFSDVRKLEINVSTSSYTYRGNTTVQMIGMTVNLITDEKTFYVSSKCSMGMLYKLIDYKKYINNIKLYVTGPSDGVDIPLKIYSMTGIKLPLKSSNAVTTCTIMSFVFFFMLCMVGYQFIFEEGAGNITETLPVVLSFTGPISAVSFVCSGLIVYNEFLKHKVKRMLNL